MMQTGKQSNSETAEFEQDNVIHHRTKHIKIQNKQDNNQTQKQLVEIE